MKILLLAALARVHAQTEEPVLEKDSAVRDTSRVPTRLKAKKAKVLRGDILDGLRNGVLLSVAIWVLIFLAGAIFFR